MESVCSLRSLVSSDEISLDHTIDGVGDKLRNDDYDYHPEGIPSTIRHRSLSTCTTTVLPIDVDGVNNKEEYRDQDNNHSTKNRCEREREHDDDQRDSTLTKLSNDNNEIDELTLYLERQNICSSDSIHSPTSLLHKETSQLSSPTTIIPDVAVHPFKRGSSQQRPRPSFLEQRSSLHRRISFDSLPEISEILDQPNSLPHDNEGYSYHYLSSGTTTTIYHDNSFTPNESSNDTKLMTTIYY
ncbi:hypothetical protein FRACYDRAFT_236031 [Fragilariopsis cylindrus CCMP1102]|uniref:Uncharacterized protein n=1 Tax=Fragilariopsis cylindrus CCMP1102 TaxID=635003 RepID=A0A1E7FP75_9STRA|nr:hypothetical protein FRACYDRAFT_236031 [Fragilariopsis cylindrus CCMP1102]|eukprot:OEU19970.1 hypothetical protein FRACYDRAFT_236031 [Fragilariopsis cylindrus CCMP1102]